jgi:peroxiredoxin Q/BCP
MATKKSKGSSKKSKGSSKKSASQSDAKKAQSGSKTAGAKKVTKKSAERAAVTRHAPAPKSGGPRGQKAWEGATRTSKAGGKPAPTARKAGHPAAKPEPAQTNEPVVTEDVTLIKAARPAKPKVTPLPKIPVGEASVLTVGDVVPEFEGVDQDGEVVKSSSLAGAPYVIYFYPKDDTPGCTTQACGFRDERAVFAEHGVRVIGVSPDSPASHTRFRKKYGLEFTLIADTERRLVTLFGVWKLKQNYGREYWGVERSTFLVGADGRIARQWRGVKVAGHVPAVLAAASQL